MDSLNFDYSGAGGTFWIRSDTGGGTGTSIGFDQQADSAFPSGCLSMSGSNVGIWVDDGSGVLANATLLDLDSSNGGFIHLSCSDDVGIGREFSDSGHTFTIIDGTSQNGGTLPLTGDCWCREGTEPAENCCPDSANCV